MKSTFLATIADTTVAGTIDTEKSLDQISVNITTVDEGTDADKTTASTYVAITTFSKITDSTTIAVSTNVTGTPTIATSFPRTTTDAGTIGFTDTVILWRITDIGFKHSTQIQLDPRQSMNAFYKFYENVRYIFTNSFNQDVITVIAGQEGLNTTQTVYSVLEFMDKIQISYCWFRFSKKHI